MKVRLEAKKVEIIQTMDGLIGQTARLLLIDLLQEFADEAIDAHNDFVAEVMERMTEA